MRRSRLLVVAGFLVFGLFSASGDVAGIQPCKFVSGFGCSDNGACARVHGLCKQVGPARCLCINVRSGPNGVTETVCGS